MTTRRQLLGMLAVAPIAAPALAKELVSPAYARGGFVRGAAPWRDAALLSAVGSGTGIPGGVNLETSSELSAALKSARMMTPSLPEIGDRIEINGRSHTVVEVYPGYDVPNRLYGATINSEGDAI